MKSLLTFIFLIAVSFNYAQVNHPTIAAFALTFEDGNTNQVSNSTDSAVIAKYVVDIKDTNAVSKIYVRISTGQNTSGDLLNSSFLINPTVQTIAGKTVFMRNKNRIYITTINTNQMSDLNYEVATEDYSGQITSFLNWEK
jgi:hypothetical protein